MLKPIFRSILLIVLICFCVQLKSQIQPISVVKDSIRAEWLLPFSFGIQTPGGDLAQRYGTFLSASSGLSYKNKLGFTFGMNFEYIFESKLKDSTIFENLTNEFGQFIGSSGVPVPIRFSGIGFKSDIEIGKIIPLNSKNRNSGVWVKAKLGYLTHKIRMFGELESYPQLTGQYQKGYDNLSHAITYGGFLGYLYLPPLIRPKISDAPSYINIYGLYAGIEFTSGKAHHLRAFNYSNNSSNTEILRNNLFGFKIGWIFTMNQRSKTGDIFY